MAEVKWIKIVVDIFDDEKMLLIESLPDADSIIVCWFKLLCLAGKQNNSGVLMLNERIAYTEEMLATVFRRPLQTVRLALETFEQFGMIEIINGTITIPNWEKHQSLDKLEEIRQQNRERQKKWYDKQKLLIEPNVRQTLDLTQPNGTDIDKNKTKNKKKNNIFVPPTLEEVQEYVKEKGYHVDAEFFYRFYSEGNWIDSKGNAVKNWKQKLITWEKRDGQKRNSQDAGNSTATEWNVHYD